ncbi:EF-hand domain-containing protein D2-like [Branchiostoma lanceolatum]|uniref:EFHD2 protein n=1 Tax=Branchiostoma lanceolatum TaxID=7740 RepID=A0A8J9W0L7_BRALA|nr:EFHD2 [Branchiostoma lanceolatum]
MSASNELTAKLQRRLNINEGDEEPSPHSNVFNPYTEFKEFSRKQVKDYEKMFKTYDVDKDNVIDINELKLMMEKLGAPQTHLGLKTMIKEVDEDNDGAISLREFLLIFRKAAAGELHEDSGLGKLAELAEIDVDKEGVKGARDFFSAKIEEQSKGAKFEAEIKAEMEEKKREAEERKMRRQAFKEKQAAFMSA